MGGRRTTADGGQSPGMTAPWAPAVTSENTDQKLVLRLVLLVLSPGVMWGVRWGRAEP